MCHIRVTNTCTAAPSVIIGLTGACLLDREVVAHASAEWSAHISQALYMSFKRVLNVYDVL
jgi:hypothetical protein